MNDRSERQGCYISVEEARKIITEFIKSKYNRTVDYIDEDYEMATYDLETGQTLSEVLAGFNVKFKKQH